MKVLIVEDEKIIRNGLVNHPQWKKWGVEEVREASNAEEALMLLLSYQPDFVCSDIKMPGMDGLQMCRIIRERYPNIQFILITGHDEKEYLKQAIDLNVVKYIEKPFSPLELREAVYKIGSQQKKEEAGTTEGQEKQQNTWEDSYIVRKLKQYIELHYYDPSLSVKSIAEYIGVTPQYLSSVFKDKTGMTVGQYMGDVRIAQAKKLLALPQYKIYEIAELVGYKDCDYFTIVFKKRTGYTPSEYRDKHENIE